MLTYNQEKYIRDAVRGILVQTYEPLEIVIFDDCSTDRTWEIINEEVEAYKVAGGVHKNIALNRNDHNLGLLANFEKMVTFCHGELVVAHAGDDISLPNRVSRTVATWMMDGSRAKLIHCGAWKFDEGGVFDEVEHLSAFHPRGACVAYTRDTFLKFPPVDMRDAYEDRPYTCRAFIMGPELYIPEKLVLYRTSGGLSNSLKNSQQIRSFKHTLAGIEQNFIDLQFAKKKGWIDASRYDELCVCVEEVKLEFSQLLSGLAEKTVVGRWRRGPYNFMKIFALLKTFVKGYGRNPGNLLPLIRMALVLLPFRLGFPLLDWFNSKWEAMRRRRNRRRHSVDTQAIKDVFRNYDIKIFED